MQQCVYETKICDIGVLQKRFMQTWFDFEQNVIDAAIVKWRDRVRSLILTYAACSWRPSWDDSV